jgi:hypothetical protein
VTESRIAADRRGSAGQRNGEKQASVRESMRGCPVGPVVGAVAVK